MASNISVLRTDYAYAILYARDEQSAKEALSKFIARCKNHPYQSDIESEGEIISLIEEKSKEINEVYL